MTAKADAAADSGLSWVMLASLESYCNLALCYFNKLP